jgi:ERCC4-type nuclease
MLIKIDYREIKLIQILNGIINDVDKEKIKISSENLPLGDIILCDNAGQERAIIERKSLADLAASIRDGRYKEQSFRLNQCELHNHQIYYLIEGDLRYYRPFKGSPDKKALLSAMTSISYFKGFSLFRTATLEETAEWILHFVLKLEKEGSSALPFYLNTDNTIAAATYTDVANKRIKKDNITPENIGEIMLAQIPNVSCSSAAAIMRHFSTLPALLSNLQNDPACLNAITTTNKTGQVKKLSKPCITAIYDFLVKKTIINVDI